MKKEKNFFLGHRRFAEERAKRWATQQIAADVFKVTRVTWGQYERGNAVPGGDVLIKMANEGLDVLYILTGQRSEGLLSVDERRLLDDFRAVPDAAKEGIKKTLEAFVVAGSQKLKKAG